VILCDLITILYVADLGKSVAWYDAVFDWPKAVEVENYVEYGINPGCRIGLMTAASASRFMGSAPPAAAGSAKAELYVRLDDLSLVLERLASVGAECTSPLSARDWGDEAAYFLDPDGYVVAVARSTSVL
jgi:catechol 2,3-dioxygenase-like lactoylglutathione lyase family enzyme